MTVTQTSRVPYFLRLRRLFGRGKKMAKKDLFTDSVHASGARSYMMTPGQPVWMDRNYAQFALESHMRNVIANRAISMVSNAAASVNSGCIMWGPKERIAILKHIHC